MYVCYTNDIIFDNYDLMDNDTQKMLSSAYYRITIGMKQVNE